MPNIFITGGTGFLGWNIVRLLLEDNSNNIFILAREKGDASAFSRIDALLKGAYKPDDALALKKRIHIIDGDITEDNLGIGPAELKEFTGKIDTIYHSAALCEFGVPYKKIRKINVDGTKNVLDFALDCRPEQFNHISTAAVVGRKGGKFYEADLDIGQEFNNTYEQTKFEAEKLIEEYRNKGLNISIFRPSVITGDSRTGEVTNFQMLYQPLHIFSLELYSEVPADPDVDFNLVPVDYVAKAIYMISSKAKDNNKAYHLLNSDWITFDVFLDSAARFFGFKKPRLIPVSKFDMAKLRGFSYKLLEQYIPYMNHEKVIFDTGNSQNALNGDEFRWPKTDESFLETLFRFCDESGYIKARTGVLR